MGKWLFVEWKKEPIWPHFLNLSLNCNLNINYNMSSDNNGIIHYLVGKLFLQRTVNYTVYLISKISMYVTVQFDEYGHSTWL